MKNSTIPKGLSDEAAGFYARLAKEYGIIDAGGLALLGQACEALDRLRQAQAILVEEGIIYRDRFGQPHQHPASLSERDARNQLLKALSMLNLDVELPASATGKR